MCSDNDKIEMWDILENTFSQSLGLLADPSARLYGGHLLGSLFLVMVYLKIEKKPLAYLKKNL